MRQRYLQVLLVLALTAPASADAADSPASHWLECRKGASFPASLRRQALATRTVQEMNGDQPTVTDYRIPPGTMVFGFPVTEIYVQHTEFGIDEAHARVTGRFADVVSAATRQFGFIARGRDDAGNTFFHSPGGDVREVVLITWLDIGGEDGRESLFIGDLGDGTVSVTCAL